MNQRTAKPLTEQTVLITGGTGGVGRKIADLLIERGAQVHISGPSPENLRTTLAENPALTGSVCDIGNRGQVKESVQSALREMESISTLINCVGIAGPRGPIETLEDEAWDTCLTTNVTGFFNVMKRVIPHMKEARDGAIINFSTASTITRLPDRTAYIASKFAVEGLTLNCARELGPYNIRCNAILPGLIKNRRMDKVLQDVATARGIPFAAAEADAVSHISMKTRVGEADVAELAIYLASPAARHITGARFDISAGLEWEG